MTTSNLSGIVKKFDLYREDRERDPLEVVLERMRDDIHMELVSADVMDPRSGQPTRATIAFTVAYRNRTPDLAQKVANELVSLYLSENLKTRTESAVDTSAFLSGEAQRLRTTINTLEKKLAEFKEKNAGRLPELMALNTELMDRTDRELVEIDRQIQDYEDRRIMLKGQLAQIKPHNTLYSETGERIMGPGDRLKVLQTEYLTAAARYNANHPDVIRLKKEISALKQKVGGASSRNEIATQLDGLRADLATARKKYSPDHPDVRKLTRQVESLEKDLAGTAYAPAPISLPSEADNPAYIELQAQLNSSESALRAAHAKKKELRAKLADFERRLVQTPQVEREFRDLTRDYDSAYTKYQEITRKEMEAKLAENLETERKGEKLTLIEPPLFPEKPTSPNRLAISLLGFVLCIAGGVGTVSVAEGVDPRVHGSRDVARILNTPPLAIIPRLETKEEQERKRVRWRYYVFTVLAAAVTMIILIHFFISPLDVLWFRVTRRLGV
jgi:uncharacterized protein involved in exopolysaccharide biosynthesis